MNKYKNQQMMTALMLIVICIIACTQQKKTAAQTKNNSAWINTPIPPEYQNYKPLNSRYEDENYQTILFASSEDYAAPSPIRIYWSVNDQVLVSVCRDQKEPEPGFHYYKLNKSGDVLDTLYVPFEGGGQTGIIGPYAVHVSYKEDYYYTTWPLNGDLTHKKIEILNGDLSWPAEKLEKVYQEIVRNGQYTFNEAIEKPGINDNEPGFSLNRIFFMENGRYKVLYKKMKAYATAPEFSKLYQVNPAFYSTSDDQPQESLNNFQLKHFQQVEQLKYEHSIGGGSPSFSKKGWAGRAFFDLPIHQDTLRIMQEQLIVETKNPADPNTRYYRSNGEGAAVSPFNLNLFTDPRLNFAIYSSNARQLYLIKPKK